MKRRFGNILAAVSLVLCIGVCVLWGTTDRRVRSVTWVGHERRGDMEEVFQAEVSSWNGMILLDWDRYDDYPAWTHGGPRRLVFRQFEMEIGPQERILSAGWRKMFFGFGVLHDWPDAQRRKWDEAELAAFKPVNMRIRLPISFRAMWMPHWFVALMFAVWPVRWGFLWRRMRVRKKRGLCGRCGYDMRESGERCPECGEISSRNTGEAPVPR